MNKILIKNLLALLVLGTVGCSLMFLFIGCMIYAPEFRFFVIFAGSFIALMWSFYRFIGMMQYWQRCLIGKKSLKKVLTQAD